ncbi:MAG: M23 family metallopeptidase [Candidatus Marinimicrobia bacterium]|nr:M23 family metallopeptidase [Candidatus Neomarinimicrobiota bacterium]
MSKRYITSIIILFSVASLFAQEYIWPTNSSKYLSSTFGEYRPGHFHSGIDIKTNYKTGYPVFSVGNGYVWRVRTSPFGYGKAIYIKMDDGNLAVYGHLDEFIQSINAYVKAEQLIIRRYTTDIYFQENEFRVLKGDTLAFTGETGTKHPHLHFEIRDKANCPINPLNTNLNIKDYTIPTIKGLAVVPVDATARVNGLPSIQIFNTKYVGKKAFTVRDTINVHGKIGIEIRAHDTVRGIPNKYPPYGIKMFVSDSLFFHVQYDTFGFHETHLVYVDRDYQLMKNNLGRFNRLWVLDSLSTPRFYSRSPSDGILDLSDGLYSVYIEVYDRNFNTSTLSFTLNATQLFSPKLHQFKRTATGYSFIFATDTTDEIMFAADWVHKEGIFRKSATIDSVRQDSGVTHLHVSDLNAPLENIFRITLYSKKLMQQQKFFFNTAPKTSFEEKRPSISFIHNPNTFLYKITFPEVPETPPHFYLQTPAVFTEINASSLSPLSYISDPIPMNLIDSMFSFEGRYNSNPENVLRYPADFEIIVPGVSRSIISADSMLAVTFNKRSVYDTLVTWITKEYGPAFDADYLMSDVYTIFPLVQPLKSDVLLSFKLPVGEDDIGKIGLYQYDDSEWDFVSNRLSPERNALLAKMDETGTVALLKDIVAPVISGVFPGSGGKFRSKDVKYINAIVKDKMSGIKDDTSITFTLNKRQLFAEYNAPKDEIRYKLSKPLKEGEHTIIITVTDQANNTMSKSSTFTIY